jgi:hypothetical protein
MDLLRTDRTYATRANAAKALEKKVAELGGDIRNIRYVIAANEEGRFAPVVVGIDNLVLAHHGITVVG